MKEGIQPGVLDLHFEIQTEITIKISRSLNVSLYFFYGRMALMYTQHPNIYVLLLALLFKDGVSSHSIITYARRPHQFSDSEKEQQTNS